MTARVTIAVALAFGLSVGISRLGHYLDSPWWLVSATSFAAAVAIGAWARGKRPGR